jgi:hypothetical protein
LGGTTVLSLAGGYAWFWFCEWNARARGLIDWKSNY